MTSRATFTQAEITRAMRAADAMGKVALWTPAGIAFLPREDAPKLATAQNAGPNTCDAVFGGKAP
jgi:hypothetical protein